VRRRNPGPRRTYIGSMQGRINPGETNCAVAARAICVMLDEIDRSAPIFVGSSQALLDVLDPRQHNACVDRYIDVPFDYPR